MIFTYVCTYFIVAVICAAVGLVILSHLAFDMGSEQEINSFRLFIIFYDIFCLSNAIWVWINYGYVDLDGDINSTVNLISICLCSYFWFLFISMKINPSRVETSSFRAISILPLIAACTIILTTPYTKLVFYYNDNNEYIHGPLYMVMVILAFFYLVMASVILYIGMRKTHSNTIKQEYSILAKLMIYPIIAGVIDVFVPNLPVMELSMMAGVVIIFTSLQSSRIYTDLLTGISNRRRVEIDVQDILDYTSGDSPLYFFLGDVNKFKYINDAYGHIEGDNALKIIAGTIRNVADGRDCQVARWGGDEFVIFGEGEIEGGPDSLIDDINSELAKKTEEEGLDYKLSMCIGYTRCTSKDTGISSLYDLADKMMYEKKMASDDVQEEGDRV